MQYMKLRFWSKLSSCIWMFAPKNPLCQTLWFVAIAFENCFLFFSKGAKKLNHEKLCVSFLTQIFPSISIYLAKVNFFLASSIGTTKVFGKQNYRFRKHSYYSSTAVFATAVAAVLILVEHPQKLIWLSATSAENQWFFILPPASPISSSCGRLKKTTGKKLWSFYWVNIFNQKGFNKIILCLQKLLLWQIWIILLRFSDYLEIVN